MSAACTQRTENLTEPPELLPLEDWMLEPGRTETFQAFLDSLETHNVRRARVKPERPIKGNYATFRG